MRHSLLAGIATLFVNCSEGSPEGSLTQDRAIDRILALPEVIQFSERLKILSKDTVRAVAFVDRESDPGVLEIYVGESHPTHSVRWNTYQVQSETGRVSRWDADSDRWVALLPR